MNFESQPQVVDILLVEDNAGDVRLTQEVLKDSKVRNNLIVACNGEEALACLRKKGQVRGHRASGLDPARPQPAVEGREGSPRANQG
jgi:CheY-like chemotaxis protein